MSQSVEECFSKAVHTYAAHASVQSFVAKRLSALISQQIGTLSGSILELGCGTGLFTENYLPLCTADASILLTDLSERMLGHCQERFPEYLSSISSRQMDAIYLKESSVFDCILSSYVLQWLGDPSSALSRQIEALKPGGTLVTAFPTSSSFPEWKSASEQAGISCSANALPDLDRILEGLPKTVSVHVAQQCTYTETYGSARHFLRALRSMGAHARPGPSGDQGHAGLRRLMGAWRGLSGAEIEVTWSTAFLLLKKG